MQKNFTEEKFDLFYFIWRPSFLPFNVIFSWEVKKTIEQINYVLPIYKDLLSFQKWGKLAHDFHFKSDALTMMVKNKNPDKLHPVSLCHCQAWDREKGFTGMRGKITEPSLGAWNTSQKPNVIGKI